MASRRGDSRIYYTRMRVPPDYQKAVGCKEVWRSLGTEDRRDAELAEVHVRAELLAQWQAMAGVAGTPAQNAKRASTLAAARGFAYKPSAELAEAPLDELLGRVEAVPEKPAFQEVTALLGGVEQEVVTLSGLVAYVEELEDTKTANRFKSADQMRKWRNPKKRAVGYLRQALREVGLPDDIPAEQVTHEVARVHQDFWKKRIAKGLSRKTAEKDYANMSTLLRAFWDAKRRPFPAPYEGLSHKDRFAQDGTKSELPEDWIQKYMLAPGAMAGLNDEARDIALIILETGCRQQEVCDTPSWDWHTEEAVPYFLVREIEGGEGADPEYKREIKNRHSNRKVPLVGVALEAARRHPEGFPRYRNNSNFSAAVNKYFREQKAFNDENGYTIGGLRHSWESRLDALGLTNVERAQLMGHSRKKAIGRTVYGDARNLEMRWCAAMLVGMGPLVEGEEREAMKARLRKLLEEERKREG